MSLDPSLSLDELMEQINDSKTAPSKAALKRAAKKANQPPRPRAVPNSTGINRLAAVEHQLIMQCLRHPALLRLARCSRALRASADAPFAFRCCPPLLFHPPPKLATVHFPQLLTQLVRHIPLALAWNSSLDSDVMTDLLSSAPFASRLRELDGSHLRALVVGQWIQALAHPSAQSLHTLRLDTQHGSPISAELAARITALPNLTHLAIRSLSLESSAHPAFFASLRGLRTLKLLRWQADASLLVGLPELRTLHLLDDDGPILRTLSSLHGLGLQATLVELIVELGPDAFAADTVARGLRSLLDSHPALHVSIRWRQASSNPARLAKSFPSQALGPRANLTIVQWNPGFNIG